MIDIGGPTLLRAAAKNFAARRRRSRGRSGTRRCSTSCARTARLSLDTRRSLAGEAFVVTAAYESAISAWFSDREAFPEGLIPTFWRERSLAYGENPHQRAAYYAEAGARRHLLSRVEQLGGKELSYNNLNDLSAARGLAEEFTLPACVIVKHANPCGVAVAGGIEDAYARALGSDPVSAYGGDRRPEPAGVARARRADRRAVRRGALRARVRGRRARDAEAQGGRCGSSTRPSGGTRRWASATTGACSAACSPRTGTATSRTARG